MRTRTWYSIYFKDDIGNEQVIEVNDVLAEHFANGFWVTQETDLVSGPIPDGAYYVMPHHILLIRKNVKTLSNRMLEPPL